MTSAASATIPPHPAGERLLVTIGALCLYRLGCQIPLPGLDYGALSGLQGAPAGVLARLSVFALGVTPIFSALFIIEIAKLGFPGLGRWEAADEEKAQGLRRAVQILALAIAAFQGFGIATALQGMAGLVEEPGLTFHAEIVATFVAATALLGWLGDRITLQGVGSGFWILLVAPYVARLLNTAITIFELQRMGAASSAALLVAIGFVVLASGVIVALAKAHYAREAPSLRLSRRRYSEGDAAFVDVWPPLLAQYVPPLVIAALSVITGASIDVSFLTFGNPLHILMTAVLIALFTLLREQALRSAGVIHRPVWPTAAAQIAICCGAEMLSRSFGLAFAINGAWLIVIVATALSALSAARAPV